MAVMGLRYSKSARGETELAKLLDYRDLFREAVVRRYLSLSVESEYNALWT
jgi:hypothetical protein